MHVARRIAGIKLGMPDNLTLLKQKSIIVVRSLPLVQFLLCTPYHRPTCLRQRWDEGVVLFATTSLHHARFIEVLSQGHRTSLFKVAECLAKPGLRETKSNHIFIHRPRRAQECRREIVHEIIQDTFDLSNRCSVMPGSPGKLPLQETHSSQEIVTPIYLFLQVVLARPRCRLFTERHRFC